MLNSLTVFLAFLGFLAFGYFSLLRTLYGQLFNGAPFGELNRGLNKQDGLAHLGSSAFFVSMPATCLLLFWGWGPALIWLVVFHLMADSLVNLQVTSVDHKAALSEYLIGLDSSIASLLMRGLLQVYLLLLMSVVLSLLAQLIDKESGLMFALVGLIPAYHFLRSNKKALSKNIRYIGAALVLLLSLIFANQLGFALYGDWAPFGENLSWLRFNNTTVLAAVLLCGALLLSAREEFSDDVSKLAGALMIATIFILIFKLIWLRPVLDAPMTVASETETDLPTLLSFSLFLFAGLTTLFFRVFNSTAPSDTELSQAANFGRVQAESLAQLLLAVLLILCLASALGIGAWKTHFLEWQNQANFVTSLNLAISSLLNLIDSGATAGNFMHTAIMAGFCIAGLNFLRVCIKALSLAEEDRIYRISQPQSLVNTLIQSKLLQTLIAFLISSYYIANGINLSSWFLIGMLAWIVVVQLIVSMTIAMPTASFARSVYGAQCLILISMGTIQIVILCIKWLASGQYPLAFTGLIVLLIAAFLWATPIVKIISRFGKSENKQYFDLN